MVRASEKQETFFSVVSLLHCSDLYNLAPRTAKKVVANCRNEHHIAGVEENEPHENGKHHHRTPQRQHSRR